MIKVSPIQPLPLLLSSITKISISGFVHPVKVTRVVSGSGSSLIQLYKVSPILTQLIISAPSATIESTATEHSCKSGETSPLVTLTKYSVEEKGTVID